MCRKMRAARYCNITSYNAENAESIGSNNGIADVITAMQTHERYVAAVQRSWLRNTSKPCL